VDLWALGRLAVTPGGASAAGVPAAAAVLITLPAAGLHPVLVGQIAEELGFVFQGYDRMSRYFLRSMSFTPAPPSGASRSSAGPAVR